jgi:hypothetical protein
MKYLSDVIHHYFKVMALKFFFSNPKETLEIFNNQDMTAENHAFVGS